MSACVSLRLDFSADEQRRLARASLDASQSRRLLALAGMYEGAGRMDAARTGAVRLQTVRDWVLAFNAAGPDGLIERKAPSQRSKLDAAQRKALVQVIEEDLNADQHGVARWRLKDLAAWVDTSFGLSLEWSPLVH